MENLFLNVLQIGLMTAVPLLLVVGLAGLLRKKYTAGWFCLVWLVFGLRLALSFVNPSLGGAPIRIELPAQTAQYTAGDVFGAAEPPALKDSPAPDPAPVDAAQALVASSALLAPATQPEAALRTDTASGDTPAGGEIAPVAPAPKAPVDWLALSAWAWVLGGVLCLGAKLLRWQLWRRRTLRWNLAVRDPHLLALCEEARVQAGCRVRRIAVYRNRRVDSPMLVGLWRPILVLSADLPADDALAMVLVHEYTHAQRHDLWLKALLQLAVCVQWFNPAAWALCARAGLDIETACDEAVVRGRDRAYRAAYGSALLTAVARRQGPALLAASRFSGEKRSLKRRLAAIFDARVRAGGKVALCAVLAVCLVAGGLVACGETQQTNDRLSIYYLQNQGDVAYNGFSDFIIAAIKQYKIAHPDVAVEVYDPTGGDLTISADQIVQKLQADISTGQGPDIILDSYNLPLDYYKMMDNGSFYNMADLLAEDERFNIGDYYGNLFTSMQYNDGVYILPLARQYLNLTLTTREALERCGFDPTACTSPEALLALLRTCVEDGVRISTQDGESAENYPGYSQMLARWVDPEAQTTHFDDPLFHEIHEYNALARQNQLEHPLPQQFGSTEEVQFGGKTYYTTNTDDWDKNYRVADVMQANRVLSTYYSIQGATELAAAGEHPLLLPSSFLAGDGAHAQTLMGVLMAGSSNRQNAIDFFVETLGETVQKKSVDLYNLPVRRGLAEVVLERELETYSMYVQGALSGGGEYDIPRAMPEENFFEDYLWYADHPADLNLTDLMFNGGAGDEIYNSLGNEEFFRRYFSE